MTGSSQPAALGQYLAHRGFAPNPGNPTWLDLNTGQQTVRVLHEPGETAFMYCLESRGGCLYEARFSPGTPSIVITAAIEVALSPPPPPARPRQAGHATGERRSREGKRDPR